MVQYRDQRVFGDGGICQPYSRQEDLKIRTSVHLTGVKEATGGPGHRSSSLLEASFGALGGWRGDSFLLLMA